MPYPSQYRVYNKLASKGSSLLQPQYTQPHLKRSTDPKWDWIQTQEPTDRNNILYNTTAWKESSNRTQNMAGSPFSHDIHSHRQKRYMDPNVRSDTQQTCSTIMLYRNKLTASFICLISVF